MEDKQKTIQNNIVPTDQPNAMFPEFVPSFDQWVNPNDQKTKAKYLETVTEQKIRKDKKR